MYRMPVPRHFQPPIVGYVPAQVFSRTTTVLHTGRRPRRSSTSSMRLLNPPPLTSWNWHGGVTRDEPLDYHHTVHHAQSNETISFRPHWSTRRMWEPVPSNLHVRPRRASDAAAVTRRGSQTSLSYSQPPPPVAPCHDTRKRRSSHAARTQDLHVWHGRESDVDAMTRSFRTSLSHPQPPPLAAPPYQYTGEHMTSHAAHPQGTQRLRYPTPDFFRDKFTNFGKYTTISLIATNFVCYRFPVIDPNELQPIIHRILTKTQDRPNILWGALLLLQRLKGIDRHWQPSQEASNFPSYLFLCAYMIARKFILDDWVCNKTLHDAMALPIGLRLLNHLERVLARRLDYDLTINSSLLSSFSKSVKRDFLDYHGRYPEYPREMVSRPNPESDPSSSRR